MTEMRITHTSTHNDKVQRPLDMLVVLLRVEDVVCDLDVKGSDPFTIWITLRRGHLALVQVQLRAETYENRHLIPIDT